MQDTHRINHPPVRNVHNHLMRSINYERRLPNALVDIEFTISHHTVIYRGGNRDAFLLDLSQLHVLVKPVWKSHIRQMMKESKGSAFHWMHRCLSQARRRKQS